MEQKYVMFIKVHLKDVLDASFKLVGHVYPL